MQKISFDYDKALYKVPQILLYHDLLKPHAKKVEYRVSAGKKGMHIIYWFTKTKFNQMAIRTLLKDDINRIRLDKLRDKIGDPIGVLWNYKGRMKAIKFNTIWDCFKYLERLKDK